MRPSWDQYFLQIAFLVAQRSRDPSTKVGAVIVGKDKDIRSTGYNGFPRGVDVTPQRLERGLKYKYAEHAERNALYLMARRGDSSLGCTLFTTLHPCAHCARGIVQAGIVRVVLPSASTDYDTTLPHRVEALGFEEAAEMLKEAGVVVEKISLVAP